MLTMQLGARLREARKRAGLSQRNVAAALEVSAGAIAHWEAGNRVPPRATLRLLAEVLKVPPTEFLLDDGDAAPIDPQEEELLVHWRGMSTRSRMNLLKICRKAAEIRMKRDIASLQEQNEAA